MFLTAKSTELLPNSQEGSKKIQSVHSSANVVQQSGGPAGFGEGETDNLPGLFINFYALKCFRPSVIFETYFL